MIFSSFLEIVSLGAVLPFLSALTSPEKLLEMQWFMPIAILLNLKSPDELLLPLTVGFVSLTVVATVVRVFLLWMNSKMTALMGIELKSEVFKRAIYQPYEVHITNNSSHLISIVTEKISVAIGSGINHVLMIITSLISSIALVTGLLLLSPMIAILTFLILSGVYFIIGFITRKRINNNGNIVSQNQPIAVRYTQEGLGAIRDIIIGNNQDVFIRMYTRIAKTIQLAIMENSFLSMLPKSIIEMIGITLIASFAYYLQSTSYNQLEAIPMLGALALGAQRLLPMLQQVYFSWSNINGSNHIIMEVLDYLNKPLPKENKISISTKKISFRKKIELIGIDFKYKNAEYNSLNKINLELIKGQAIGLIGETGSGKSTLVDLFMCLLEPTQGKILVDGIEINSSNATMWQSNIAHVPQTIFLSDAPLIENIAFGIAVEDINFSKVKKAARQASLNEFIESLPHGYYTTVGERGVQLSGGQKQRIGIARALYKEASIIVFDEATSALDNKTEKDVMQAINLLNKDLTIILIAHRLTTLKNCDIIYKLYKGHVVETGSYLDVIKNKSSD
jgi:ATP-binding cassette subfamily B protein